MRTSNEHGWSKPDILPTGNDFLPDTNTQALLEMIEVHPPGKERDILRACYERKMNTNICRIRDLLLALQIPAVMLSPQVRQLY